MEPGTWELELGTCLVLIAAGLALALREARRGVRAARELRSDPERALAILLAFRRSVVGLALAGVGAAWTWDISWLLALSLIIGGQELLESTVMIRALKDSPRLRREERPAS
jgi:hypothetical protein